MHEELQTELAEYSQVERIQLLRLAHESIREHVAGRELPQFHSSAHLAEKRGAFTTLHLDGHLRGCIGSILPAQPLYQTVMEMAVAAASEDPRFAPVTADESLRLQIEISVLSLMFPIQPEQVVVGKHGLMITFRQRRGLLLPQVPLEWGWDREQFLTQLCYKAGLPADAWARSGAKLEAFTAEVFGEAFPGESLSAPSN